VEEAFWRFIDQKCRGLLNMAAAKLQNMDQRQKRRGRELQRAQKGQAKTGPGRLLRPRGPWPAQKPWGERPSKRCRFVGALGCTGTHPPMMCKAFGDQGPEEKKKIIKDNRMCPFSCSTAKMTCVTPRCPTASRLVQSLNATGSTFSGCMRFCYQ
jgi:hypothetical protein